MRFQSSLSTYSHDSQRKKKNQSQRDCKSLKERKNYYDSFNLFNPEGTIHLLLKGDILTSYEHSCSLLRSIRRSFNPPSPLTFKIRLRRVRPTHLQRPEPDTPRRVGG